MKSTPTARKSVSAVFIPEPDGSGFTVRIPSLRGCLSFGKTLAEAKKNAREAVYGYIQTFGSDQIEDESGAPIVDSIELPA